MSCQDCASPCGSFRTIFSDANDIINGAIADSMPQNAVRKQLADMKFGENGRIVLVAVGKAAWTMADSAHSMLGDRISTGVVITKYGHSNGPIGEFEIYEAGHPVSDENTFKATERALEITKGLKEGDNVLFLLSGGGSALFEKPLVSKEELKSVNERLLASGANIVEMNVVRKRLSAVKGGRFGEHCKPATVHSIILSDILGSPLDMIASGPAAVDESTSDQAFAVAKRRGVKLSDEARECLKMKLPQDLGNVKNHVVGSVRSLCASAKRKCEELGYKTLFLTASLACEAREAGSFIASIAREYQSVDFSIAFIFGGETVVQVKGKGIGGRNQELCLSAVPDISECYDTLLFSLGSDGTDGPTDAAGGIVSDMTWDKMLAKGINPMAMLDNNDSYNALKPVNGLIITGPTGTNVNDLTVLLIKREKCNLKEDCANEKKTD